MIRILTIAALTALSACVGDETLTKYGAADKVWELKELGGKPFSAQATIEFVKDGVVSGQAPCNSYSAKQSEPYPWFKLSDVVSTEMACEDLSQEAQYFATLQRMTLAEVSGTTLILSNDAGELMVFRAQ